MKYLFLSFFVALNLNANDLRTLIGENNTLQKDVEPPKKEKFKSSFSPSCACSGNIMQYYNQITQMLEDYTNETTKSLESLRKEVAKNKNELANRSDSIKEDEYYQKLNNAIKYINGDIKNHKDISNVKLSAYNNLLLLSENGILYKNNNILNLYSEISVLEELENKIKLLIK